jgi:hypothetical protein
MSNNLRFRRGASVQHGAGGWRDVTPDGESLPWWGKPTETPAVFELQRSAKELVHESCTADTRDHEDHTFCGARRCAQAARTLAPTRACREPG